MKPSLPQGTRDFNADVVKKRQYIFDVIKNVFTLHGFMPLETPAFENMETLLGKYGDEGDKLIFKIFNNGLHDASKIEKTKLGFETILQGKNSKDITERALKYDLTIPFARYVAMNIGTLTLPYKRYQIQPVWRADRPQRGRYREFYQCDADVVGSTSLFNEIELIGIYNQVFTKLQIPVSIQINNRKILVALAELCGNENMLTTITTAIDKLDKIGLEKVCEELQKNSIDANAIEIIKKYLSIQSFTSNKEIILALQSLFKNSSIANTGIKELEDIISHCAYVHIDVTLARGLNYYTGTILEVKPTTVVMGSIGGGGRYDNLTGLFDVPNIPGVGISFGVDRIYDVLEELNLFPNSMIHNCDVLILHTFNTQKALATLQTIRNNNISCEMYTEDVKIDKQYKYAEKRTIKYVLTIQEDAMYTLKNTITGERIQGSLETILSTFK